MESTWRKLLGSAVGYVRPAAFPLRLLPNSRARSPFNRACFKIEVVGLPEVPCVYVMRRPGSNILRIGTAAKGLRDRVVRGYNRPCQATHPCMTLKKVYHEWQSWAGGAHLTNALVMYGLARAVRKGELEFEVYPFRSDLLSWERFMLDAYAEAFGQRPALNRGRN